MQPSASRERAAAPHPAATALRSLPAAPSTIPSAQRAAARGPVMPSSRRKAAAITVVVLLLAIGGGYYAAKHISIDTDVDKLINPNLPWRQREKALDTAFPQNADLLLVVIDA